MDGSTKRTQTPAAKLLHAFSNRNFHVKVSHSGNAVGIGFTHFTLDPRGHIDPQQAALAVKMLDHLPVKVPYTGLPENTKGWSHLDKQEYADAGNAGLCSTPLRAGIDSKGDVVLTLEGRYADFPKERVNQAYDAYTASHAGQLRLKQAAADAAIGR